MQTPAPVVSHTTTEKGKRNTKKFGLVHCFADKRSKPFLNASFVGRYFEDICNPRLCNLRNHFPKVQSMQ